MTIPPRLQILLLEHYDLKFDDRRRKRPQVEIKMPYKHGVQQLFRSCQGRCICARFRVPVHTVLLSTACPTSPASDQMKKRGGDRSG